MSIPVQDVNRVKALVERGDTVKQAAVKMGVQTQYVTNIMKQTVGALKLRASYKWRTEYNND